MDAREYEILENTMKIMLGILSKRCQDLKYLRLAKITCGLLIHTDCGGCS